MRTISVIILMLLIPVLARAQDILPDTYGINGTVVSDPGVVERTAVASDGATAARLMSGVFTSSFGVGGMSTVSLGPRGAQALQLTTGYVGLAGGQSNISGMGLNGSMIPVYLGYRHDIAGVRSEKLVLTWYAAAGAGPVLGLEYGGDLGFAQQFRSLGFRWGGGAYAGSGVEFSLSGLWAMRAQLEYDGLGFLSPLAGRSTYAGPSFCLGFQFGL